MTLLDVLEAELGDEIGPDLIAHIDAVPSERIVAAAWAYDAWANGAGPLGAAGEEGELRPFVTAQAMNVSAVKYGLAFSNGFDGWAADSDPGPLEDAIKRLLLFCHRVVLNDPVIYITDYYRFGDPRDPELHAQLRAKLAGLLTFLSYLRPLLEREIVTFVPQNRVDSALVEWTRKEAKRTRKMAKSGDFSGFEATMGMLPRSIRWMLAGGALKSVRLTAALGQEFPDQLDLFFPDPLFVEAAVKCFSGQRPRAHERHAETLRNLLAVDIPRLEGLTVRDVVAMRDDEDAFVLWRDDLATALRVAASVDAALDHDREQVEAAREVLTAASARLRQSVAGSSVLTKASRGSVRMALGAAVDLVLRPREVLAERVKQAADLTAEAVLDRDRDPAAVLRHYALFDPPAR